MLLRSGYYVLVTGERNLPAEYCERDVWFVFSVAVAPNVANKLEINVTSRWTIPAVWMAAPRGCSLAGGCAECPADFAEATDGLNERATDDQVHNQDAASVNVGADQVGVTQPRQGAGRVAAFCRAAAAGSGFRCLPSLLMRPRTPREPRARRLRRFCERLPLPFTTPGRRSRAASFDRLCLLLRMGHQPARAFGNCRRSSPFSVSPRTLGVQQISCASPPAPRQDGSSCCRST